MYKGFRIVSDTSSVKFMSAHILAFVFSAIIVLGSIGLVLTKGLNFGIDFTGGMLIEVRYDKAPDLSALRKELNDLGHGSASLQEFGSAEDLLIRFPQNSETQQQDVENEVKAVLNSFAVAVAKEEGTNIDPNATIDGMAADMGERKASPLTTDFQSMFDSFPAPLDEKGNEIKESGLDGLGGRSLADISVDIPDGIDYRRFEFVGPQVGKELISAGLLAIIFSIGGILAYVSFRFEWQFGVASVVALTHDAIAIIGLFALTQMEFDLATVAAVLMIAGYSINDTVVVFDRVRENLRKFKKKPLTEVLDLSLNQTLARTLLTSVTTMLALVALWVFGGEVIRGFIDALIFGILVGTYSSVFVASPVLIYLGLRARDVVAPEDIPVEEKMV